jgi:hypothetical protein
MLNLICKKKLISGNFILFHFNHKNSQEEDSTSDIHEKISIVIDNVFEKMNQNPPSSTNINQQSNKSKIILISIETFSFYSQNSVKSGKENIIINL